MKLHEYQAKELLARHGVPVPPGIAAKSVDDAVKAAEELGGGFWVVKAQVHAGGRGKGRFKEIADEATLRAVLAGEADVPGKGGVQLCRSIDDVKAAAQMMLGNTLVTKQTGVDGVEVKTVLVTTGADIDKELYVAVLLDRSTSRLLLMASTEGGTEIEEVAAHNPGAIKKVWADPITGLGGWQCRQMAYELGLSGKKEARQAAKLFQGIYQTYLATDASMVEINPMVVSADGDVVALDAKVTIDDNALFRQKEITSWYDESEDDPAEVEAAKYNLSFIKLDGNIGCMVNGAGLAMATMDIIKLHGGDPANFLDVGGGATKERVSEAFKLILSDDNVEAVLVNIFGGIVRCDLIADGVIAAVQEVGVNVPVVVRLAGNNADLGVQKLDQSGLNIIAAEELTDAAEKVVKAVGDAR
jgi:succinyl-CoA synthetase beta subunit